MPSTRQEEFNSLHAFQSTWTDSSLTIAHIEDPQTPDNGIVKVCLAVSIALRSFEKEVDDLLFLLDL